MGTEVDITEIDWNNSDVNRAFEYFSSRVDDVKDRTRQQEEELHGVKEENKNLKEELHGVKEELHGVKEENKNLKEELRSLKAKGYKSRKKARSYNTRKYKEYPRPKDAGKKRPPSGTAAGTVQMTTDQKYCPKCGLPLSDPTSEYGRSVEDVVDGKWSDMEWTVVRRYCKSCSRQWSAPIPGVLPKEHFGTNVMAQIATLRCFGISEGKIQKIYYTLYGKYLDKSTVERIARKVGKLCRPLYDKLWKELLDATTVNGDETGWFKDGVRYWIWVFVTALVIFYHISPSRSKQVAEAILAEFDGIVGSDSYSAWNDVGSDHQKCLLHYFRDLYRTLDKNHTDEFKALFDEMHGTLKDAISLAAEHPEGPAPKEKIQKLQDRIDAVAHGAHTDKDCKRYAKRLRREGRYLLTFLERDVAYHNNTSERALRIFACERPCTGTGRRPAWRPPRRLPPYTPRASCAA